MNAISTSLKWADLDHAAIGSKLAALEASIVDGIDADTESIKLLTPFSQRGLVAFSAIQQSRAADWVVGAHEIYSDAVRGSGQDPSHAIELIWTNGTRWFVAERLLALMRRAFVLGKDELRLCDPAYRSCAGYTEANAKNLAVSELWKNAPSEARQRIYSMPAAKEREMSMAAAQDWLKQELISAHNSLVTTLQRKSRAPVWLERDSGAARFISAENVAEAVNDWKLSVKASIVKSFQRLTELMKAGGLTPAEAGIAARNAISQIVGEAVPLENAWVEVDSAFAGLHIDGELGRDRVFAKADEEVKNESLQQYRSYAAASGGMVANANHSVSPPAEDGATPLKAESQGKSAGKAGVKKYRSDVKLAIRAALIRNRTATALEVCRAIDEEGAIDCPWGSSEMFEAAYKDKQFTNAIDKMISDVRKDMKIEGRI